MTDTFEMYRETRFGDALVDALQVLLDDGRITQDLAFAVLKQFDRSMLTTLQTVVPAKATIKADIDNYRNLDNVWQFNLSNVEFKLNSTGAGSAAHCPAIKCDRARIVCVDGKLLGQ